MLNHLHAYGGCLHEAALSNAVTLTQNGKKYELLPVLFMKDRLKLWHSEILLLLLRGWQALLGRQKAVGLASRRLCGLALRLTAAKLSPLEYYSL